MKRRITLLLLALFLLPMTALADVSVALYKTTVQITNAGSTTASNITVPFTLSTANMISGGMLGADCLDSDMITGAGSQVKYMPSANATYPWVMWLTSIAPYTQISDYLYTKGATDGLIRYFPDTNGMTTTFSASLEPSNNFTIEQKGFVDTTAGVDKYLISKEGALDVFVSLTVSGNITAGIVDYSYSTNVTPSSGSGTSWTDPDEAYDDDTGTDATYVVALSSWTDYITFYHSPMYCRTIRFYAHREVGFIQTIDVDVSADNVTWTDVYEGDFTDLTWEEKALPDNVVISYARVRFYNQDAGGGTTVSFYEFDFGQYTSVYSDKVSITGVTTAEHTITTSLTKNLVGNGSFEDGTSSWDLGYYGGEGYARVSTPIKVGNYALSVNNTLATAAAAWQDPTPPDIYIGQDVTLGCWVWADTASRARIGIEDVGETGLFHSSYHSGGSSWEWLSVTLTITTFPRAVLKIDSGSVITVYFDGATMVEASSIAQGGNFSLTINGSSIGVWTDNTTSTPDTATDWQFLLNNTMPYMEYQKIWIGGTLKQNIDWEYATTFQDATAYNNDAVPTFRTTGDSGNVTASVVSQVSTLEASTPNATAVSGWNMISEVPVAPPSLYVEGGATFPGGARLQGWATEKGVPFESLAYPLAIGTSVLAGLIAFALTHNANTGVRGSLMVQVIVTGGFWLYWIITGGGVIPSWTVIPFGLFALLLLMWRNPNSAMS